VLPPDKRVEQSGQGPKAVVGFERGAALVFWQTLSASILSLLVLGITFITFVGDGWAGQDLR